ncbi:MAG: hypothetical protein N3A01_09560 [Bacteroidales bacterium]|nr:hypothetical protein [Bacteroidales bacterium]
MKAQSINKVSLIITIIYHLLILLFLILFKITQPLPLPGELGILINFGNTEHGLGANEPDIQVNKENVPTQTTDEGFMTQNIEEAPVLNSKTEKKTEKKKHEKVEKTNTKEITKAEINKPQIKSESLFPGTSQTGSGSEGENEGIGNQGNVDGDPLANSHVGINIGGGNSYYLGGRGLIGNLPKPQHPGNEQGKVVVEIFVNRQGKVVSANPGIKGSTLVGEAYLKAAKEAALKAQFEPKSNAPELQRGTITYFFGLK